MPPAVRRAVQVLCLSLTAVGFVQAPVLHARLARTLTGHREVMRKVAFSPDARLLATSSVDRTVKLWNVADGSLVRTLTHPAGVTSVAFSADGARLASGSFDKTVRVWRVDSGAPLQTLTAHEQAVVSVSYSPDGRWLATGGDDSKVRLWRAADGRLVRTLTGGSEHVYSVAFSPDGEWLASGGRERGALGTLWKQVVGTDNWLTGDRGVTVRLWRVRDGALQQRLAGHSDDVGSVAISADGRWLASASEDRTVTLWRLERAAATSAR